MRRRSSPGGSISIRSASSLMWVKCFPFPRRLLTFHFKTELAINKGANVRDIPQSGSNIRTTSPDISRNVSNTGVLEVRRDVSTAHNSVTHPHPTVPWVRSDSKGSRNIVSNTRNTMERHMSTGDQNRTVSITHTLTFYRAATNRYLDSRQVNYLD